MNIKDKDDYSWNYSECYLCKNSTHQKEMRDIKLDYEVFAVKGYIYVQVCKECYRESQLNKLI